jgi:hypothetical protein
MPWLKNPRPLTGLFNNPVGYPQTKSWLQVPNKRISDKIQFFVVLSVSAGPPVRQKLKFLNNFVNCKAAFFGCQEFL